MSDHQPQNYFFNQPNTPQQPSRPRANPNPYSILISTTSIIINPNHHILANHHHPNNNIGRPKQPLQPLDSSRRSRGVFPAPLAGRGGGRGNDAHDNHDDVAHDDAGGGEGGWAYGGGVMYPFEAGVGEVGVVPETSWTQKGRGRVGGVRKGE